MSQWPARTLLMRWGNGYGQRCYCMEEEEEEEEVGVVLTMVVLVLAAVVVVVVLVMVEEVMRVHAPSPLYWLYWGEWMRRVDMSP